MAERQRQEYKKTPKLEDRMTWRQNDNNTE